MNQQTTRWRFAFTALVLLAEIAHLAWEHFHGGIVSHHFLARADMPSVSNAWGLVLLPALAWFLTGQIQRRLQKADATSPRRLPASIVIGFLGALLLGALLSISFTLKLESVTSTVFFGLLLSAFFLRVYRAECVLGFVIGMTFTFGVVLPTIVGVVVATVSAFFRCLVYPQVARGWNHLRNNAIASLGRR